MSGAIPLLPVCAFMAWTGKQYLVIIVIIISMKYADRIKLEPPDVVGVISVKYPWSASHSLK
jgi:hypothetical protein